MCIRPPRSSNIPGYIDHICDRWRLAYTCTVPSPHRTGCSLKPVRNRRACSLRTRWSHNDRARSGRIACRSRFLGRSIGRCSYRSAPSRIRRTRSCDSLFAPRHRRRNRAHTNCTPRHRYYSGIVSTDRWCCRKSRSDWCRYCRSTRTPCSARRTPQDCHSIPQRKPRNERRSIQAGSHSWSYCPRHSLRSQWQSCWRLPAADMHKLDNPTVFPLWRYRNSPVHKTRNGRRWCHSCNSAKY